jgi:release factor glutamine methyltransferase
LTTLTIREALQAAGHRLAALAEGSPALEAEILLACALDRPRSHLLAWPDKTLTPEEDRQFQALLERRAKGEPIAYILGYREFWSLKLRVTPDTLIPRPDTELLVERALALIPVDRPCQVADLGTGSGAIAAAIASERPRCQITATDSSAAALAIARGNFQELGLGNVVCALGAWGDALPRGRQFDLLLSNPPYIPDSDPHLRLGDLPWEPASALAAGTDGLDAIRQITATAPAHLVDGGWLILEHGFDQGIKVRNLLAGNGFSHILTHRDLAGLERITEGQIITRKSDSCTRQ